MNFGITLSNRGVLVGLCTTKDLLMLADAVEASPVMDSVWCGDALFVNRRLDALTLLAAVAGPHRAGAARPGLHGLVRAAQSAGVRLRVGLARRAVERPHAAGRLRRRRRGPAVGGGVRRDGHGAGGSPQAHGREHARAASSRGPRTTSRSRASSPNSPTSRWSRSRCRIPVRSGSPPTPSGCPRGRRIPAARSSRSPASARSPTAG